MKPFIFRLSDIGEGVAEAEIVAWHVKVGDRIDEDTLMVDVMTDKATVEMTAPVAGLVTALHGEIGDRVPVGSALLEIVEEHEAAQVPLESPKPAPLAAPEAEIAPPVAAQPAETAPAFGQRPLASPATRHRAHEQDVPLHLVPGTGPQGRITAQDLVGYLAHGPRAPEQSDAKRLGIKDIKIVGLRRKIAEKMQEATRRIPHFTYVEEFDMTELEALRTDLNADRVEGQPKLTLLPFFMRALVRLLPAYPQINARYDDEAGILKSYEGIHIGIATQTSGGLMVPVVRHAEARDLWDCTRELGRVTAAARDGSAALEDLTGSTITLTSLGALGGIAATPIINHPEVAIIGPNKLVERPVVRDGQVAIRKMMNLSSSFDHRIVDGYDAAQFIQALKRLIERPALIFIDPR